MQANKWSKSGQWDLSLDFGAGLLKKASSYWLLRDRAADSYFTVLLHNLATWLGLCTHSSPNKTPSNLLAAWVPHLHRVSYLLQTMGLSYFHSKCLNHTPLLFKHILDTNWELWARDPSSLIKFGCMTRAMGSSNQGSPTYHFMLRHNQACVWLKSDALWERIWGVSQSYIMQCLDHIPLLFKHILEHKLGTVGKGPIQSVTQIENHPIIPLET